MADNSTEMTPVTLSLLPMEDLAVYLNMVKDFITKNDKATDVESVAGVPAGKTAIAISSAERTTVNNALNLGGIPANKYVTTEQGSAIATSTENVRNIYGKEIADLRDELYQMQQQLHKAGIVTGVNSYSGFRDTFNVSNVVHEAAILGTATEDSVDSNSITIDDGDFDSFEIDDYIVIKLNDVDKTYVVKVIEKAADGMTLKFTPDITESIKKNYAVIYKSLGTVEDGAFNFYKKENAIPDSTDMYSTLNDDTFRLRKQITASNTGYAWSFRIPENQKGFLTKLGVTIKTYGTPGALMCYIIDERNQEFWKNPVQAASDKILLAKSQPLTLDASYGEKIANFNFYDGVSYPLLNEPDTTDHKIRYVAIIEALDADSNNYYDLLFLQTKLGDGTFSDLQINNLTYTYAQQNASSKSSAFTTSTAINSMDVYYSIVTRGVIQHNFIPYREAVYSAKFKSYEPIKVSDARLTMRIAREGYFKTDNAKATAFKNNGSVPIMKDVSIGNAMNYDMSIVNGVGVYKNTTDLIIGNEIRKIKNQNLSSIVLEKGMWLDEVGKPVYRAGYHVYLKAWRKEWNPVTCELETKDYAKTELPLSFVMPDKLKRLKESSDRLIYEASFRNKSDGSARLFNEFEVQAHWETEYGGFYEDTGYKEDMVGRIHDFVLSLDRGI